MFTSGCWRLEISLTMLNSDCHCEEQSAEAISRRARGLPRRKQHAYSETCLSLRAERSNLPPSNASNGGDCFVGKNRLLAMTPESFCPLEWRAAPWPTRNDTWDEI